jgi:hypothetical protein
MRTSAMIAIAAMLGSGASAATRSGRQKVAVCIEGDGSAPVARAMARAYRLFTWAGVKLEWHSGLSFCQGQHDQAIMISLLASTPKAFLPGALAYASPYEGVHIQVFYDRIARSSDELLPYLLAYVFVHEIAHILQGFDRHSDRGIMKASWNSYDYTLMKKGQLWFTGLDIQMIHHGLAARAARLGTLVGVVAQ